MNNKRLPEFHQRFKKLPPDIQRQASRAFLRFLVHPESPGLHFERLKTRDPFWSVRIGLHYRAVGFRQRDTMYWVFIGSHAEYDAYIKNL